MASLAEEICDSCIGLNVTAIEATLVVIAAIIPTYMAWAGMAIRLGNLVILKPHVAGSIDHEAADLASAENNIAICATACPALRYFLSRAMLLNRGMNSKHRFHNCHSQRCHHRIVV